MRTIFFAIYFICSVLTSVIFLPKYYILGLFKNKYSQFAYACKIAKKWSRGIFKITGSTIEIVGKENIPTNETLVIVSNHQSNFDIPVLLGYIDVPFGFVAKKELSKIPIFSTWMKYFKCVFINRGNPKKSLEAIYKAIKNINDGYSQLIFPEGTRSKSNKIGQFKPGSFKIATKTGATILPVTINNTYKIFEKDNKIQKTNVKLVIHKPIKTSELDEEAKKGLASYVQNIIQNGLD